MFGKKSKIADAFANQLHAQSTAALALRDDLQERAADISATAAQHAAFSWDSARETLMKALHEALERVPSERLHELKENAGGAAAHTLGAVAGKASAVAGKASAVASEVAASAAHKANAAAHRAQDAAGHAAQSAAELAREKTPVAQAAARDAVQTATTKAGLLGVAAGKALHDRAARYVPDYEPPVKIVEKRADLTTKLLCVGVGVLAGVIIGVLLAPSSGRRNRALLKDKFAKTGHDAADLGSSAAHKASDLGRRASGAAHELKEKLHPAPDTADDHVIAERVRAELGHNPAASHFERFDVEVVEGKVTLRGPAVDETARAAIEAAVQSVKGVREVEIASPVAAAVESGDDEAFVG